MRDTTNHFAPPAIPHDKLLLDARRTAEVLGVSPRTVATLVARGELASVRIGSRRLFPVAELKAFVEKKLAEQRQEVSL